MYISECKAITFLSNHNFQNWSHFLKNFFQLSLCDLKQFRVIHFQVKSIHKPNYQAGSIFFFHSYLYLYAESLSLDLDLDRFYECINIMKGNISYSNKQNYFQNKKMRVKIQQIQEKFESIVLISHYITAVQTLRLFHTFPTKFNFSVFFNIINEMFHNQRKSLDNRNLSYLEQDREKISLNYTSSIKSNNKDNQRDRCFSSYEKPQRKYQYQHEFMDQFESRPRTPSAQTKSYNVSYHQTVNNNERKINNSASAWNQQRKEKYQIRSQIQPEKQYQKTHILQSDLQSYGQNKNRRINKNYYGGLGNRGYADVSDDYSRKTKIQQPSSNLIEERSTIGAYKQRKYGREGGFQKSHGKWFDQNKENLTKINYTSKDANINIKQSFEKLNEQQIFQKIGRINKLNGEINSRLQTILAKVSAQE